MDSADPLTSALWTSLGALVPVLPPQRTVPALQRALRDLLAAEPVPAIASPPKKNRSRWTGNIEAWAPIRTRVLTVLAARGMTRRELAAELGISYPTLRPALLPRGSAPSRANIERLRHWLEAMEGATDGAANNGHAREAAPPAYRLTAAERERLAAYRALEEERTLRDKVGITGEVIDAAISGEHLNPKIISRLAGFLAEHQPAAG